MEQLFGVKEISNVVVKTNSPINFGNRQLSAGEPIFYLEQAQMTELSQSSMPAISRGGKNNSPLIVWENRGDLSFRITAGLMTKETFGMLTHSQIFDSENDGTSFIHFYEDITLDANGIGKLQHLPISIKPIFCFLFKNDIIQDKVTDFTIDDDNVILSSVYGYQTIRMDYYFYYGDKITIYQIGNNKFNTLLSLEGMMEWKGATDGINYRTFFRMPSIKMVNGLHLILGNQANPVISVFDFIGLPKKDNISGSSTVMELTQLD